MKMKHLPTLLSVIFSVGVLIGYKIHEDRILIASACVGVLCIISTFFADKNQE